MNKSLIKQKKGFTIIELMIATTVFSFVLLVASTGVIAIGRLYYKGVTSSKTQEATRSIVEDIARARQFKGSDISYGGIAPGIQAICFGEERYTYNINNKIIDSDPNNPSSWGVRHDIRETLSTCSPAASGGEELLSKNMRLLNLSVAHAGGTKYSISVKVAYGDNDLLSTYNNNGTPNGQPVNSAECKSGIAGSNFCAVSELATVVDRRIK